MAATGDSELQLAREACEKVVCCLHAGHNCM